MEPIIRFFPFEKFLVRARIGAAPEIALTLSAEHTAMRWLPYPEALDLTHFEDNRVALWELDRRLRGLGPRD